MTSTLFYVLVIIHGIHSGNTSDPRTYYPFETLKKCSIVLNSMRIEVPDNTSDDVATVTAHCAPIRLKSAAVMRCRGTKCWTEEYID